jgi:hypothetical protein
MYVFLLLVGSGYSFGVGARKKRWLNPSEWVNETLPHSLSL